MFNLIPSDANDSQGLTKRKERNAALFRKITPFRRQSKTHLITVKRGSKIVRNSLFDCHWSQVGRQMAIKNSVSNNFYLLSPMVHVLTISIAANPV